MKLKGKEVKGLAQNFTAKQEWNQDLKTELSDFYTSKITSK